jgi:hypothetical protein
VVQFIRDGLVVPKSACPATIWDMSEPTPLKVTSLGTITGLDAHTFVLATNRSYEIRDRLGSTCLHTLSFPSRIAIG